MQKASLDRSARPGLGLIGVGAFGAFCLPHLQRYFDIVLHDAHRDLGAFAGHGMRCADLATAAGQEVVLLAVPARAIAAAAAAMAPHLTPGALVLDVCSIKVAPLQALAAALPASVDIVGTHPLFGPQSGRDGIRGLRLALCPVRGDRAPAVARFLRRRLGLEVIPTTPEAHDREMAYVQGLTHLVARIVAGMPLPPLAQTTRSFDQLMRAVDTVRHDSDELFRTVTIDNPFVAEVANEFYRSAGALRGALFDVSGG